MPASHDQFIIRRNQCPGCSSTNLRYLYKRSYMDARMRQYMELAYHGGAEYEYVGGANFEIAECAECHLLFQTDVLNEIGLQRLYDVWINADLAKQWFTENQNMAEEQFRIETLCFAKHYLRHSKLKLLDYGAGFGGFCRSGKTLGFDVAAFEFSRARAAALRSQGISALMPGDELNSDYDLIILNQVLEHLTDPFETLQRVNQALRDDGLVFVAVPNCRGLTRTLRRVDSLSIPQFQQALLGCSAFQHINSFTAKSLTNICERADFVRVFDPFASFVCYRPSVSPIAFAKKVTKPFYRYLFSTVAFFRKK